MSTKKNSQLASSEIMEPHYLKEIEPPSPPQFPTFKQLVEIDRESLPATLSAPPRKLNDLFDGILGTLAPLLDDYQATPEKYGPETHELLGRLILGSTSPEQLSENDRRLLNLATLDFYTAVPKKPEPLPLVKEATKEEDDELANEDGDPVEELDKEGAKKTSPVTGVDLPVTELPAYWWLS